MKSNYLRVLLVSIFTAAATVSATPLLDRLLHVLDLTESQITQLREAEERVGAVARRVESAVQLGSLSPEDGRAHIQAAREDLEAVMLEVLSDEQLARWRRSLETDRASDRESDPDSDHSTDRSPTPLLSHLLHVLDLTESQITQLREAEERVSAVARRVESAVHSGSLSREDGGAHLQAAWQDLEAVILEVLSHEQLARWRRSQESDVDRDSDRDSDVDRDRVSDVDPARESDADSDRLSDRSPTPLLSRLLHVLDLTESQITQLREAEEHVGAVARRVESAVHSGSLSPEDGGAHLQAARQDLEAVWQEVLSEEQLARWRQSLETDRKRDPDVAVDGEGATENSLTAPTTSVQERSWGQIKRERAR